MELPALRYPRKSRRKIINYPPDGPELAELVGVLFGDGGIANNWQVVISLNSILDLDYSVYIIKLFEKLFKIKVVVRKRPGQNTLVIVATSINLINFLTLKGVVRGNKVTQGFDIPKWIATNREYKKFFVRGLIDTDGCLYIHRHTINGKLYENLGLCFTSYSRNLLYSTASIFSEFNIKPHISRDQHIYLYSYKAVLKYLDTFGSSNSRILRKYNQWRGRLVV